jgi:hypothetical protein
MTRRFFVAVLLLAYPLGLPACSNSHDRSDVGCPDDACSGTPRDSANLQMTLGGLQHSSTLLPGSRIRVWGSGFNQLSDRVLLQLIPGGTMEPEDRAGSDLWFVVPRQLVTDLEGSWSGTLRILDGDLVTEDMQASLTFSRSISPVLLETGDERVHLNDLWMLRGDGFLHPGEGHSSIRFQGTFTSSSGSTVPVDTVLPAAPAEAFARDRGFVVLTTTLAGLVAGSLQADCVLQSEFPDGQRLSSSPIPVTLEFTGPELFSVAPDTMRLGQIVEVSGAGFAESQPGTGAGRDGGLVETTALDLEGTYFEGNSAVGAKVQESIILRVSSGTRAEFVLEATQGGERLVSSLFRKRTGRFEGTARVVTSNNRGDILTGEALPVVWHVITTGQVVLLRFLPGFDESLGRFGLMALQPEVTRAIADVIETIYEDFDLDVRLDSPEDLDANHYSVVEIGGPDPNGYGLFGMDNTPGKDVGNLRLFDTIGGTNVQTQADGYPGFGGVFIDAFLYFSHHPPFPGERPATAPAPEGSFDDVFDPVRQRSASLAEYQGHAGEDRRLEISLAVQLLAHLVGETTAHEIGHSLGLADPYGPPNAYHNSTDEPGCLMDTGNHRPFGERAGLPGAAAVRICHDHPHYLLDVLGPRSRR